MDMHVPLTEIPAARSEHTLALKDDGKTLVFTFDTQAERTGTARLLRDLDSLGIWFSNLDTRQSSLEDIFVSVVEQ